MYVIISHMETEHTEDKIDIQFRSTDEKNQEAFFDFQKEFKKTFPDFKIKVEEVKPPKEPALSGSPMGSLDPNSLPIILDNPVFHFGLQTVLIYVSGKVLDGLLGKVGSDIWEKFKKIVSINKKDQNSFKKGVVLKIPMIVSSQKTVEVFFFLDSVPNDKIDESVKLAYKTFGNITTFYNIENLEKISKIGFFYNQENWEVKEYENI